jgi:hypothetical protein
MLRAKPNSAFHTRLFGYASKLGGANHFDNRRLSNDRMNAVLSFMQGIDSRTLSNIEKWEAHGSANSPGGANDNSPEWRAVEVHIFIGEIEPTPVPPNMTPAQPHVIPLPGGQRFKRWSIAAPGGAFVGAGIGGGFNVFFIRNDEQNEIRGYLQGELGFGGGVGVSGLKTVWSIIQSILTGVSFSSPDFISVTPTHPVTWAEVEGCLVRVTSLGAGAVVGYSKVIITFDSASVSQYGPSGMPIQLPETLFQFDASGKNYQLGINGSVGEGILFRVD